MAQEVCVTVGTEDRARLAAIIADRNRPLKHIQRAQIILFSADRLPVLQVARRAGASGAGRSAMPKLEWMGCCATKPGRPAGRRCRARLSPKCWR
jgi:hypothetical protein